MAQMVAGASTSGPVFFLGVRSVQVGDVAFGVTLLFVGAVCFFLPGFLMQQFWQRLVALKLKVVSEVRDRVLSLLPDRLS